MRARVGGLAAVLVALGCGRSGLELDDGDLTDARGGVSAAPSTGGSPASGGGGGGSGRGGTGGTGAKVGACDAAFSDNGPIGDAVSTFTAVSSGFVCATDGEIDEDSIAIVLESALGSVPGVLTWDAAKGRLSLAPSTPLALATKYTATASLPGATLIWSFTTTDGEWQPEEEVGRGGDLALAIAPDGQGIIGFHAGGPLSARRFTLQGGFSNRGEIISDGPVAARSLRVGVAASGDVAVVWGIPLSPGFVWGKTGTVDGGFGATMDLGQRGGQEFVEDLALAGDGTGVVLMSARNAAGEPGALFATPIAAGGFGMPVRLSEVMPLDTVRALARPDSRSWALWSSWGSTGRVLGRHAAALGQFGGEIVMREPAARAGFAAMQRDGSVLAVWEEGSPLDSVKAARVTPEGVGEPPVSLDTGAPGGKTSGIYVRAAVDDLGRGLALWVNQAGSDAGTEEGIRAQRFDLNWAPASLPLTGVTVDEWAVISPMGLALDPHGNGFAGFGHGAPARAQVARFREATGWQHPIELATSATAPLVAVDASGRAAAVWASDGRVFLRRFIELTAPRPRH